MNPDDIRKMEAAIRKALDVLGSVHGRTISYRHLWDLRRDAGEAYENLRAALLAVEGE